ncbi:MAG: type IX secretion system membrane protein PorP/SprF, partial [Bacteroidetes bacterium]|nr:type IX secretion system membrane protein PorP/SprF [Bacteroidota bacterium]
KQLSFNPSRYLSFGVNLGLYSYVLNLDPLYFDAPWEADILDPLEQSDGISNLYHDLGTGLYYHQQGDKVDFQGGMSIGHILQPEAAHNTRLSRIYYFHSTLYWQFSRKSNLIPSLLFQQQARSREFVLGTYVQRMLDKKTNISIGTWLRSSSNIDQVLHIESSVISIRLAYDKFKILTGYDINLSSLRTVSKFNGGYELVLIYEPCAPRWRSDMRKCPRL